MGKMETYGQYCCFPIGAKGFDWAKVCVSDIFKVDFPFDLLGRRAHRHPAQSSADW